ncbi:MAG: APC family permease [Actinomycetota bacterium]|nr:APC family permease [Actinomycetota bacterium]
MTDATVESHPHRLQKGVLSVPNGIALAAAAMAPVLAVVLNAPAAAPEAGLALPLSFLISFIACLFIGNNVVQFSRRLPSAGSFYTFNSQGLGRGAGFFTGWLFSIGYGILAPGLFDAFGSFFHDYAVSTFNLNLPWWIYSLAALAIVVGLSIRSIRASVRIDLTLLSAEVIIFLILAVTAILHAGHGNTIQAFVPSSAPKGVSGVGIGVVFGILSFIGFDAAATLGEETKNPRRNVPLSVAGALGAVGIFYVFVMYSLVAGYRLNDPKQLKAFINDANPFVTMAHQYTPWLLQPVELAAVFGLFSCFLAIHNTTVRIMFSMGRDRILPAAVGKVHPRWYSPYVAIFVLTGFTLVVGLSTGVWLTPGASGAYGFTGSIGTVAIVLVYMGSSFALIRYFWKLPERSMFKHVILPALGVVALAYPLYAVAKPGQSWPYNLVFWIVVVWIVLGFALYRYFLAKSPEKIAALGTFVAEDDLPLEEQPEALLTARATSIQEPTVADEHRGDFEETPGGAGN